MARKPMYLKRYNHVLADPQSLLSMAHRYLEWMCLKNYTPMTIEDNRSRLGLFLQWCDDRAITLVSQVTPTLISCYHSYIVHRHNCETHQPLSASSRFCYLNTVCKFFYWLAINNHVLYNPTSHIDISRPSQYAPRHVLTQEQAEKIINQPDITTDQGIRDRAILETFYSSGIRVCELANLDLDDANLKQGILRIRQGKGRKDRLVPLGARACQWIEKYLYQVRCRKPHKLNENALFLTFRGYRRLSNAGIAFWVGRYIKKAGINKKGRCHLFRQYGECYKMVRDCA